MLSLRHPGCRGATGDTQSPQAWQSKKIVFVIYREVTFESDIQCCVEYSLSAHGAVNMLYTNTKLVLNMC